MRKISITICFLVISLFHPNVSFGQEIKVFPDLTGTTVNDSIVTIPDNTKGKYTLIGLAFSKKSEASLETWLQPAFYKFIEPKLVKSPFASFTYDVNIYFVPMFTGINAAAAKSAKKQALKKMDPKLHDFVLFYKGELKKYKSSLGLEKRDVPYFFVLDPEGNLVLSISGGYTDFKMEEIETILDSE